MNLQVILGNFALILFVLMVITGVIWFLAVALLFVPTIDPLPDKVVGLPISVASVRASGFATVTAFSPLRLKPCSQSASPRTPPA